MGLIVETVQVDLTQRCRFGGDGPAKSGFETTGELYRWCLGEYGRCKGYIYISRDGKEKKIGWVFEKREKYEYSDDKFLCETWVTVHEKMPIVTRRVEKFPMEVA